MRVVADRVHAHFWVSSGGLWTWDKADTAAHGARRGEGHCETAQDRYPQVGDNRDNNRRFP